MSSPETSLHQRILELEERRTVLSKRLMSAATKEEANSIERELKALRMVLTAHRSKLEKPPKRS